jgi:hypothetical protein
MVSASPATFAMLLQMTFEKLGKAAFARRTPLNAGHSEPPHNHKTASELLQLLLRTPGGASVAPTRAVLAAVAELECAHPSNAEADPKAVPPRLQSPQLEFPWRDPATGSVLSPANGLPIVRRLTDPQNQIAPSLLKFGDALVKQFNTLFPPHPP